MAFTVHRRGALEYLRADSLSGTVHGFTTRYGGVSGGYLSSLNLGVHRGDDPENVRKNYEIIGAALGFDPAGVVMTHQVHSDVVRRVGRENRGEGLFRPVPGDFDGLITDEPGVVLAVFSADCV
ncbi:MAG: laccase domain-containing protein, partial [Oscillospiraceae bacterium]|nr:laccase domain-containing protein [Oscillospiraceae bacterium]